MSWHPLIYPVLSALTFMLCNLGAKLSLKPDQGWLLIPVCCGASVAYWFFRRACEVSGLAVASSIIDSLAALISVMIGLFVLHEQLLPRQYIGLVTLFVGLYLIREG